MKTIFFLVGTFDITGTGPWAVSSTGLTAGGSGAGASGFSPHFAQASAAFAVFADGLGDRGALSGDAIAPGPEEGVPVPCAAALPPLAHPVTAVPSTSAPNAAPSSAFRRRRTRPGNGRTFP
ncbi:hypothetical protein ACIP9H_02590 [Streptomyces sp. NPDC088732]|uniref:hypothetical protein n=1 Tax=Streptomyces sp. NPDC088732 TaxID=3365879 RepID=UPI00380B6C5C